MEGKNITAVKLSDGTLEFYGVTDDLLNDYGNDNRKLMDALCDMYEIELKKYLMEKYVLINYDDLTDKGKDIVNKNPDDIHLLELKKGKTGYVINQRPISVIRHNGRTIKSFVNRPKSINTK